MKVKKDYLGMISSLIRASYIGEEYRLGDAAYKLKPTLLGKYDILRSIANPSSEIERLLKNLPRDFKTVAKSELYRKEGGWLQQGVTSRKFTEVVQEKKVYLVPFLGDRNVGIDTSSMDSASTVLCICCFDDAERGYQYLDRYLRIPKTKDPSEFKWRNLNQNYKKVVMQNLDLLLKLSSDALLVIKTNALISPEEKMSDIFIKIIDGCFSGYQKMQGEFREKLRDMFFTLTNNVPVHCDPDFTPLTTEKVVRFLVKSLAREQSFVPLHVALKSEESHPIQVADLICGSLKTVIKMKDYSALGIQPLPFYNKLKGRQKEAKAYYWLNKMSTRVPKAVVV